MGDARRTSFVFLQIPDLDPQLIPSLRFQVDEGQRLKSDTNLIFQRLKILNCRQKVLLTGESLSLALSIVKADLTLLLSSM